MAGYSQMNNGYNEQPGVNWGQVGLYAGGGVMAAGMVRMGGIAVGNSSAFQSMKSGARSTKNALGDAGSWTKRQVKKHGGTARNMTKRGATGMAGRRIGGSMSNRYEGFAQLGQKKIYSSVRNAQQRDWVKQGGNPFLPTLKDTMTTQTKRTGIAPAHFNKYRNTLKSIGDMPTNPNIDWAKKGAGKAGAAALGFFGAMDYKGAGLKRAGMIGARGALGMGAVGLGATAGMAALDFLNPFGFGSISD